MADTNKKPLEEEKDPKQLSDSTLPAHDPYGDADAPVDPAATPVNPLDDDVADDGNGDNPQPPTRKGCSVWAWILGLIVIVGVFVGAYFFFAHEEGDAARKQATELALEAANDSLANLPDDAAINATDDQIKADAGDQAEALAAQQAEQANLDADGVVYNSGTHVNHNPYANLNNPADLEKATDEELALRVMKGEFGNAPDRQARLGARYAKVQAHVNRMAKAAN